MNRTAIIRQLRYLGMWSGWITQPRLADLSDRIKPIEPPVNWGPHYRDVQAQLLNDGLKIGPTDFSNVKFYVATMIPKRLVNFICRWGPDYMGETQRIWGITLFKDKAIVLVQEALDRLNDEGDTILVRHESTHMIRGVGGHEPEYFNAKYNNVWRYDVPIFEERKDV